MASCSLIRKAKRRRLPAESLRDGLSFLILLIGIALLTHRALTILPVHSIGKRPAASSVPDFIALARQFAPSLVRVSTIYAPAGNTVSTRPEIGDPPRASGQPGSLGSGVIIDRDGHILTNHHVVEHAEKLRIRFSDRRELDAAVVGRDVKSDIALLKVVTPRALIPAPFGDSSRLEAGEWVLAMGSPFGLDNTVTAGIVSASSRRIPASDYYDYIQTDLAINPGNSGGPLLNLQGRVVGVNTAMFSRDGANTGVNFAIPINLVKELLPELLAKGRVARGWLGMSTRRLTPALARLLGIESSAGAVVTAVDPRGPAAAGGIHAGDVIVGYDGKFVNDASDLLAWIAKTAVGRHIPLRISRDRILYRVVLPVGELKEEQAG